MGFIDDLELVCVIVGHLGVEGDLGLGIDASIDQTDSVQMQWNSSVVSLSIWYKAVLAFEVVGECRTVMSSVGFGPDAEFVFSRFVLGKSNR